MILRFLLSIERQFTLSLAFLAGKAAAVAASTAATYGYSPAEREGADASADYLTAKRPYLDCYTALANGWPIATGVIETTLTYCEWEQHRF